jgi:hypothetical protein
LVVIGRVRGIIVSVVLGEEDMPINGEGEAEAMALVLGSDTIK